MDKLHVKAGKILPLVGVAGSTVSRAHCNSSNLNPVEIKNNADSLKMACRHVMHRHLVFIPEPEVSMQGLGEQASFFLMAICIRCADQL